MVDLAGNGFHKADSNNDAGSVHRNYLWFCGVDSLCRRGPGRSDSTKMADQEGSGPGSSRGYTPLKECPQKPMLVAEDNLTNQRLAVRLLNKLGCNVDLAGNGRDAVAMAGRQPYDIIFMDC